MEREKREKYIKIPQDVFENDVKLVRDFGADRKLRDTMIHIFVNRLKYSDSPT